MAAEPRHSGFDAGWLFVVAGVVICAAGLLIPAQRDLLDIRLKRDALRHEEAIANERLAAHSAFLVDIEREDPLLVRRLAAAQLNLMHKGDTPVLLASSGQAPVTAWIDATVRIPPAPVDAAPSSPLSRLATGPQRLWLLCGGVLAVFLGLLLDPSIGRPRRAASASELIAVGPQQVSLPVPSTQRAQLSTADKAAAIDTKADAAPRIAIPQITPEIEEIALALDRGPSELSLANWNEAASATESDLSDFESAAFGAPPVESAGSEPLLFAPDDEVGAEDSNPVTVDAEVTVESSAAVNDPVLFLEPSPVLESMQADVVEHELVTESAGDEHRIADDAAGMEQVEIETFDPFREAQHENPGHSDPSGDADDPSYDVQAGAEPEDCPQPIQD